MLAGGRPFILGCCFVKMHGWLARLHTDRKFNLSPQGEPRNRGLRGPVVDLRRTHGGGRDQHEPQREQGADANLS